MHTIAARRPFQLVFWGAVYAPYIPRYRRRHPTLASAEVTAREVLERMSEKGLPTACHAPIVYGPGCGPDGKRL